jgi:adenylosuccinate synthase
MAIRSTVYASELIVKGSVHVNTKTGSVTAVVGAQWGDEGKGKIVDALASEFDAVVRFQGGANAGHTINNQYGRFALHLLPSGIFEDSVTNILGPGTAVHVPTLLNELRDFKAKAPLTPKLFISDRAQIVLDAHVLLDQYREEGIVGRTFGSTRSGIAPFYSAKFAKRGIRIGEVLYSETLIDDVAAALEEINVLFEHTFKKAPLSVETETEKLLSYRAELAPYITDTSVLLYQMLQQGKSVLVEGQLGALRDPDHGVYPYSTSSSTLAGHATVGAGVPPHAIKRIIAVAKAYSSKVGTGPFVVEMKDDALTTKLRTLGGDKGEFGATTGRPRDVGWFDAVATRYGVRMQGATEIALTNLDVLGHFDPLPICVGYKVGNKHITEFPLNCQLQTAEPVFEEIPGWNLSKEELSSVTRFEDLPKTAQAYVERIEKLCECRVSIVSVGPRREQMILR